MQITTLIENLVYRKYLFAEHGLSILIENDFDKILVDTGQTGNFTRNANYMGIDIKKIEYVVITHGHFDHIGGLDTFLEINNKAKIIMHPNALQPKFHGNKPIGSDRNLKINPERISEFSEIMQITDNIYVLSNIENRNIVDIHKKGFYIEKNGKQINDPFDDEVFVCVIRSGKINIISSCSHNGITNIIEKALDYFDLPVNLIIGGFHLKNSGEEEVKYVIDYMNDKKVQKIGFCHCSGIENYSSFKLNFKGEIFYNYTGNQILIN